MSPNCFVFVERKTDKLAEYQRDTEGIAERHSTLDVRKLKIKLSSIVKLI